MASRDANGPKSSSSTTAGVRPEARHPHGVVDAAAGHDDFLRHQRRHRRRRTGERRLCLFPTLRPGGRVDRPLRDRLPVGVVPRPLDTERGRRVGAVTGRDERARPGRGRVTADGGARRERPVELGGDGHAQHSETHDHDSVRDRRAGRCALRAHLRRHPRGPGDDRRFRDLAARRLGRPHEPRRLDRLAVRVVPGHGQRDGLRHELAVAGCLHGAAPERRPDARDRLAGREGPVEEGADGRALAAQPRDPDEIGDSRPGLDPRRADDRRHAWLHLDAKALGRDGARRGHSEVGVVAGDLEAVRVPPDRLDRDRRRRERARSPGCERGLGRRHSVAADRGLRREGTVDAHRDCRAPARERAADDDAISRRLTQEDTIRLCVGGHRELQLPHRSLDRLRDDLRCRRDQTLAVARCSRGGRLVDPGQRGGKRLRSHVESQSLRRRRRQLERRNAARVRPGRRRDVARAPRRNFQLHTGKRVALRRQDADRGVRLGSRDEAVRQRCLDAVRTVEALRFPGDARVDSRNLGADRVRCRLPGRGVPHQPVDVEHDGRGLGSARCASRGPHGVRHPTLALE